MKYERVYINIVSFYFSVLPSQPADLVYTNGYPTAVKSTPFPQQQDQPQQQYGQLPFGSPTVSSSTVSSGRRAALHGCDSTSGSVPSPVPAPPTTKGRKSGVTRKYQQGEDGQLYEIVVKKPVVSLFQRPRDIAFCAFKSLSNPSPVQ